MIPAPTTSGDTKQTRAHGRAETPQGRRNAPAVKGGTGAGCRECGAPLSANREGAGFCSDACRSRFHHRRKNRGAVLYDLFMVHRHRRGIGERLRFLFLMNRLAAHYLAEDERERDGRESWRPPAQVAGELGWLHADRLKQGKRR